MPGTPARFVALDVGPEDQASRLAVLCDQVTLAFPLHDAAAAGRLAACTRRWPTAPTVLTSARLVAARVEALDGLAAGELAVGRALRAAQVAIRVSSQSVTAAQCSLSNGNRMSS